LWIKVKKHEGTYNPGNINKSYSVIEEIKDHIVKNLTYLPFSL